MQRLPTSDEQRKFLEFFYQAAGAHDMDFVKAELKTVSDSELKKMVVGQLPCFYEMGWTDDNINAELKMRALPEVYSFKRLNAGYVKKLLKLQKLGNDSDVLILKETKENGMLDDEQIMIAERLLAPWNL